MTTEPTLPTTGVQSLSPSHHNQMDDSELSKLYHSLKHIVWVIKLEKTERRKVSAISYCTGFCVSGDGLIMTNAKDLEDMGFESLSRISVRKLYSERGDRFIDAVTVKNVDTKKFNVAFLKIEGSFGDFQHITLDADGSLLVGETLLFLGNPNGFLGSFLIGRNAFHCTENVNLPIEIGRRDTCEEYASYPYSKTPDYRIMGRVFNRAFFDDLDRNTLMFERRLYPSTPIIQCYGFGFAKGCEGGPVFNTRGDVVGMMVLGSKGFQVAIHVTVLRSLLKRVQEEEEDRKKQKEDMKKKQEKDKGVSKKPRRN